MTAPAYGGRNLNLRLVAYAPDGDRIGELPQPTSWSHSRVHNGVSSLSLSYSRLAMRSSLITDFVEIAVEWNDGANWREDSDSRHILMEDDGNEVEPTLNVTYTCPGYGWLMQTASVVTTIANSPDNINRTFSSTTPGAILQTLILEAQAVGCIPGVILGFTAVQDSSATPWQQDALTISFERGTLLSVVLDTMAAQGLIDYRWQGRRLMIYNPRNELAVPRANRKRVKTTTTINPITFMNTVSTVNTSTGAEAKAIGYTATQFKQDILALASDGQPKNDNGLNQEFVSGVWQSNPTREVATYRQIGPDSNGVNRAFGWWIADVNRTIRYVLVIDDPADAGLQAIAQDVFTNVAGGLVVFAGTSGTYNWYRDSNSAMHQAISAIQARGIAVYQVARFDTDYKTTGNALASVIVQSGKARWGTTHEILVDLFNAQGSTTLSDINDAHPLGTPPTPRQAPEIAHLHWDSVTARTYGSFWARIAIKTSWLGNPTLRGQLITALKSHISTRTKNAIPQVTAKPSTDPDVVVDQTGQVDLRYGRDILEAPVRRTRADLCGRVYSYGDQYAKVVVENPAAQAPWGIWEKVIGQGGVTDAEQLEDLAYSTIDKGATIAAEVTRTLTFQSARYFPYRDYDHGDFINTQSGNHQMLTYRINQIVVNRNQDGTYTGNVTMDTAYETPGSRQVRAIKAASGPLGGSRTGGTGSKPAVPTQDKRKPKKPVGNA